MRGTRIAAASALLLAALAMLGALVDAGAATPCNGVTPNCQVVEPLPVDKAAEEEFAAHLAERQERGKAAAPLAGEWQATLVPGLQAGWSGWCLVGGGALHLAPRCPVDPGIDHRLPYEAWEGDGGDTVGVEFLEPPIEAVAVDEGDVGFASAPVSGFAGLLSAVAVQIPSPYPAHWSDEFEAISDGIRESGRRGLEAPPVAPSDTLAAKPWTPGQPPPSGPCALSFKHMPTLSVLGGRVLDGAAKIGGIVDDGLLSCADVEARFHGVDVQAALLLSAGDPGARPVALPGAGPVPHRPLLRSAPGVHGPLLAERHGEDAWLVIEGGTLALRERLLADLRARVAL